MTLSQDIFTLWEHFKFILATDRFRKIREKQKITIIETIYRIMLYDAEPGNIYFMGIFLIYFGN